MFLLSLSSTPFSSCRVLKRSDSFTYASASAIFSSLAASWARCLAMLSKLCLYDVVGGGLGGFQELLVRNLESCLFDRVLLLVGFVDAAVAGLPAFSKPVGVSLRCLRGAKDSKSASSSSLLDEDMLAESEFVTAGTPFLTIRLLELCELTPERLVRVEKEEKDILAAVAFGSCVER